jgi:3-oxoacyl-[acyl-carrier-protein] synthase II
MALADAGLPPDARTVGAVLAHGTGTPVGDAAEIRAIQQVYGAASERLWVTSIKGHVGHSMAASGVMALVAGVLGMREGRLPPTLGTTELDPEVRFQVALGAPQGLRFSAFQVNAFGFGGQNASLVISQ